MSYYFPSSSQLFENDNMSWLNEVRIHVQYTFFFGFHWLAMKFLTLRLAMECPYPLYHRKLYSLPTSIFISVLGEVTYYPVNAGGAEDECRPASKLGKYAAKSSVLAITGKQKILKNSMATFSLSLASTF
jgi:hypothetical protein